MRASRGTNGHGVLTCSRASAHFHAALAFCTVRRTLLPSSFRLVLTPSSCNRASCPRSKAAVFSSLSLTAARPTFCSRFKAVW